MLVLIKSIKMKIYSLGGGVIVPFSAWQLALPYGPVDWLIWVQQLQGQTTQQQLWLSEDMLDETISRSQQTAAFGVWFLQAPFQAGIIKEV